ncbi:MAG: hypothetical protein JNK63_07335 [Chthonomonas sp.]|nr:hypothetical protein [Chthonomonas sp.]
MKRTNKTVGLVGAGMILVGLIASWFAVAISRSNPAIALGFLFGSSLVYIIGGVLTVSHFDFRRGTKVYLVISLSRLVYACAAVLTMIGVAGS